MQKYHQNQLQNKACIQLNLEANGQFLRLSDLPYSAFYLTPCNNESQVLQDQMLQIPLIDWFILFLPSSSIIHYIYILRSN